MAKILISGEWLWKHYQEACATALIELGHEIIKFEWQHYFFSHSEDGSIRFRSQLAHRQNKYLFGPLISRLNSDLYKLSVETTPDIIWLYNDNHIFPGTIRKLRNALPRTILAQYANDNPWGRNQSKMMWRHFKKSVPYFDINFCYRPSNMRDLHLAGSRHAVLLRSYFIPEETYPVEREGIEEESRSDVVFVGHFEDDGRMNLLSEIARAGFNLKLFGTDWDMHISKLSAADPLTRLLPVRAARGEDYIKAICGSKIALAFLSKLNEDTYTRRSFEIPAMRTFMLSEYTDDLNSLFAEGKEAEYFRNESELLEKIRYYLSHQDRIKEIATNGYERVRRDGHDVKSRMRQFMDQIAAVRK